MNKTDEEIIAEIGQLYTALRKRFDRVMSEHGASLAQTKMLVAIQAAAGMLRAADIADRFGIAPRTVTEALDALEREALIVRMPDLSDRRMKRLKITPAGEAAVSRTEPIRDQISHEIMEVLDPEERTSFANAVQKLLHCNQWT
ncbi:MAG: MarR family transcriptional regulator [Novosphingobium sp.]|uniref:MarR family transcriptional regulator n=1 Tax=Novosphingobium indicum TaxID=462949 RepID=A0ABQ2K2F4_9SPHN|nr:MarR family transcriptional regulator [Novosphingobium indicum]MAC58853.1 MarR family transcriptional regulator [Novosphingobium sp.]GGN61036.1 MarR family transcriptional regulator [Novosphingobium indicum]